MPQQQPEAMPKEEPESASPVVGCSQPVASRRDKDIDHQNEFEADHDQILLLPSALLSDLAADFDNNKPYQALPAPTNEPSLQWGTCTTAMVRNIPPKYTQAKFLREVNGMGFMGRYDFLYLPMDMRRRTNRGFAFLNFNTPEIARSFHRAVHGKNLPLFPSEKPLEVSPADIQGFEANAHHYLANKAARRGRDSCTRPIFLRSIGGDEGGGRNNNTDLGNDDFFSEQSMAPREQPQVLASVAATWSTSMQPPTKTTAAHRFCSYCGQPKRPEHRFCSFCGGKVLGLDPIENFTGTNNMIINL